MLRDLNVSDPLGGPYRRATTNAIICLDRRARSLADDLGPLPYALREEVGGYVDSVEHAASEIYQQAEVEPAAVPLDAFLTFAGIWRLWTQVYGQRWMVDNSLAISSRHGIDDIRLGSSSLRKDGGEARELQQLHRQLRDLLDRKNAGFVRSAHGVREILTWLATVGVDGR